MAKADFNYRADPNRAINLFGPFNDELINRVLPQISAHRAKSSEPITVYINSPGGLVRALDVISGSITAKDADGNSCRMITVAAGDCSSAAASLFTLGGYAIAYPHSSFHFHGIRLSEVEVTMEDASSIAQYLTARNREIALEFAQAMIQRLLFRYLILVEEIGRLNIQTPNASLIDCFTHAIGSRVSLQGHRLLQGTTRHVARATSLSSKIFSKVTLVRGAKPIQHDLKVFRALLTYEARLNRSSGWRLDEDGMARLTEDYFLLRDFHIGEHHKPVELLIDSYGHYFLNEDDSREWKAKQASDAEDARAFLRDRAWPFMKVFWYFTVVLARLLQQGENRLEAEDAYWLGAADEVVGTELRGERMIMEEDFPPAASST